MPVRPGTASGRGGDPGWQLAAKRREGQRTVAEQRIVEGPQVETRTVPNRDLAAELLDLAATDHVRQRLARPGDVAVGLDDGIGLGQAGPEEEVDRLLARPAECMKTGVYDEPCGTPGNGVEHSEALGFVPEEAHLVGKLLAVEAPALDIRPTDDPGAQPAECIEPWVLHLERDLEMVAGDRLVVCRRGELRVLPARQVVAVGVVDPGTRAIGRRREVIRERGVLLLELLDRADLDAGLREGPEVARRDRHGPVDILASAGEELLLRSRLVRRVGGERRPIGLRVGAEARVFSDLATAGFGHLEFLEADPVDVLRLQVERRPGADLRPVERIAVRSGPQSRLLARRREVLAAKDLEEGGVGGIDLVADDVADALAILLGVDLCHRRNDRLGDRDREQPLELLDGPLGDKDRKSTRLNSSHGYISYAVFCLKKKNDRQGEKPRISMKEKAKRTARV